MVTSSAYFINLKPKQTASCFDVSLKSITVLPIGILDSFINTCVHNCNWCGKSYIQQRKTYYCIFSIDYKEKLKNALQNQKQK